jgi:hypothetical protein
LEHLDVAAMLNTQVVRIQPDLRHLSVEFSADGKTVFAAFSGPNAALRRFEIPQDVGSLAEPNSSQPQNNFGTAAGDADKFPHR